MDISELVKALELELLQPEVRKSKVRLNELIADDFIEVGASGKVYAKQDVINELADESEVNFRIQNFKTIGISPDTLLTTYTVAKEYTDSKRKSDSYRMSIWKNIDVRWQIVFHRGKDQK